VVERGTHTPISTGTQWFTITGTHTFTTSDYAHVDESTQNCTAPSLIPTVNGNAVRSFSTHGQQSAAKGSSTTVSRSDTRLIHHFDSSALWSDGPEVALTWPFPYPQLLPAVLLSYSPHQPDARTSSAIASPRSRSRSCRHASMVCRSATLSSYEVAATCTVRFTLRRRTRGALPVQSNGDDPESCSIDT
jgi:hypothetical protein